MLVTIFKGKGVPLKSNLYRWNKIVWICFQVVRKDVGWTVVWVGGYWQVSGFMQRKGMVYAVFILIRFTEKFRSKNWKLFFVFVYLEKAFDWVSSKVASSVFWRNGVLKYFMWLYQGCKTAVSVKVKLLDSFSMKVGVCQRST